MSVIKRLWWRIEGMIEGVLLFKSFFKHVQYFFTPVLGSETAAPKEERYFSFSF